MDDAEEIAGWRRATPDVMFYDGDQLLVAVPVVSLFDPTKTYYEYSVIRASCDSEMPVAFRLSNGDDWGWEWDDVDWYMPLSEFRLPTIERTERLDSILALARQYAHPGCNPGAHGLASKILQIAGERE